MINGIFQNGLDDELQRIEGFHLVLRRYFSGEFVFITHFLDGEIVAGVLQLVGDGDDVAATAQRDAEKAGQRGDHDHGILCSTIFCHPHHAVQRVVKEVGVDLGLKNIQLTAALLLLLLNNVVHQVAHCGNHGADGVTQVLHLIGAAYVKVHILLPGLQFFHSPFQLFHRCRNPF